MRYFLKVLFKKYRRTFDDFFIEDLIGDIPPEVSEGTLKFLATGKRQLDRWMRWEAYVLQRKLQQATKHSEAYFGGLVFIQALATMLTRMENEKRLFPDDTKTIAQNDVEKDIAGVDEFFKGRTQQ